MTQDRASAAEPRDEGPAHLRLTLLVLALGLFVVATNAFVIAGLLPHIADDLRVHPNDVALSITAYAAVVAVLSPAFSIALARVPRTGLIVAGLILVVVGNGIVVVAPGLELFVVGRIVAAVGGAALVPTATAVAALLAPPHRRARSIAVVVGGFAAASALGAPLGTLAAGYVGWRGSLLGVAILAVICAVATPLAVRRVPKAASIRIRTRFRALLDPRLLFALATTVCATGAFNTVYIFSSQLTEQTTGGAGTLLALVLFSLGVAGLVGNAAGGQARRPLRQSAGDAHGPRAVRARAAALPARRVEPGLDRGVVHGVGPLRQRAAARRPIA